MSDDIEVGQCDVCLLLDSDERLKPVMWCEKCQAYLCDTCRPNAWRRFRAAWKRRLQSI